MPYQYVGSLNRYRDTRTGRFVPRETVLDYTEQLVRAGNNASDILSERLTEGLLSLEDFSRHLKAEVKSTWIQEYILGRGGRDAMTPSDWGTIGRLLRDEYKLIDKFVVAIDKGERTPAQISAQSAMYFRTAQGAYERGNANAFGVPKLPAYPKDGSTSCHSNCYCYWDIVKLEGDGNFDCTWVLDRSRDNCPECLAREDAWKPLRIREGIVHGGWIIS